MPSLKDLKNRIASVKATQKITKAMKMVAAAKLRRAQEAAEAARPYAERMNKVLASLSAANAGNAEAPLLLSGTGRDQVHLLVVATGERGLAGGFNSSIIRLARDHALKLIREGKTVKILTVGRKGNDILRRTFKDNIVDYVTFREVKQLSFANADDVARRVLDLFNKGEFDVATLFYARFQSVIAQVATAQQIIPAKFDEADAGSGSAALYEYEPSEEEILADLLPRNVAVQIFRALLENNASFYGAQMSAMDNATRNAGEMINKLTLSYNRQRQAQITKELIEIISGAEAL
ncbi:ATP synthase subunit gamma, membrane-bound, F1 sector [Pseudorhizobium banfieldiae]|jgi:F-type H+-transporting ATPase subunit gamma|uniref:ATP synthase gamma chain n=2 Tax=Pseudorhizobium TaxID=1903858 RepID=L0NJE0_9HYPH|nr:MULTISPECIES: F0F1 ATP synthase subunit gamma [Pseudorhizobium]CAD6598544.1 F0F1 ATP synthase subunit gamma [Rhizobium sp. TCK]CAD6619088.1 F0F1 ATP synthase subunit gamma [arsenite-oxidising bacterium NT-25]CAD7023068.1 F0F1 ATP synthase subunit gamma [Pseudorhizobium halotolerans]CCF21198.1 ATP synthase subunit gamma, membrane-bound, F1 sector [Pseudorhizobium banfieldiae]